jgi:rifampicin phosphotransferase
LSDLDNLPWNDTLRGDFLWTHTNFGEAMPEVMTPLSWSLLRQGPLSEWLHFAGYPCYGNIGGRLYFNVSVLASILHAIGKSQMQILEMLEGTFHSTFPPGMAIPLIPAGRGTHWAVLSMLLREQIRQMRNVRRLPCLLASTPVWYREMHTWVVQSQCSAELAALWGGGLWEHTRRVWWGVLSSTNHLRSISLTR